LYCVYAEPNTFEISLFMFHTLCVGHRGYFGTLQRTAAYIKASGKARAKSVEKKESSQTLCSEGIFISGLSRHAGAKPMSLSHT